MKKIILIGCLLSLASVVGAMELSLDSMHEEVLPEDKHVFEEEVFPFFFSCVSIPSLTLEGHTLEIGSAEFDSHDRVITASRDHTVKIWNAENGECLVTLAGHDDPVIAASFNKDESRVVTVAENLRVIKRDTSTTTSRKYTTKIWDVNSKLCLKTFSNVGSYFSLAYSANKVAITEDQSVKIIDLDKGELQFSRKFNAGIQALKLNDDASKLFVVVHDELFVIDPSQKNCEKKINFRRSLGLQYDWYNLPSIDKVFFSKACDRLIICYCKDFLGKVFDLNRSKFLSEFTLQNFHYNGEVAFNHESDKVVVTNSMDSTDSIIWDVESGTAVTRFQEQCSPYSSDFSVCSAEFSRDGDWVLTQGGKISDVKTGNLIALLDVTECNELGFKPTGNVSAHFNVRGNKVVTLSLGSVATVWDVTLLREAVQHVQQMRQNMQSEELKVLRYVYECQKKQSDCSALLDEDFVNSHDILEKDSTFKKGYDKLPPVFKQIVDLHLKKEKRADDTTLPVFDEVDLSVLRDLREKVCSRIAQFIIAQDDVQDFIDKQIPCVRLIKEFQINTNLHAGLGAYLFRRFKGISGVVPSRAGNRVLVSSVLSGFKGSAPGPTKIFDIHSWSPTELEWQHFYCGEFSPNDEKVLTISGETYIKGAVRRWFRKVKVWDCRTGKCINSFPADFAWFSHSDDELMIGLDNGTVEVVDATTCKPRIYLKGHKKTVKSVACNKDGDKIITASSDGMAKIWSADDGRELLSLEEHGSPVLEAQFNDTSDKAFTRTWRKIKVWDTESGECLHTIDLKKLEMRNIMSMRLDSNGEVLVTGSKDGIICIYKLGGRRIGCFKAHETSIKTVNFGQTKDTIISSGYGKVRIWDIGGLYERNEFLDNDIP